MFPGFSGFQGRMHHLSLSGRYRPDIQIRLISGFLSFPDGGQGDMSLAGLALHLHAEGHGPVFLSFKMELMRPCADYLHFVRSLNSHLYIAYVFFCSKDRSRDFHLLVSSDDAGQCA